MPSRTKWLPILLILALLSGGGWLAYQNKVRYKRFSIHDAGKVYRSSWLQPSAMGDVVTKYKIRTVLNLCDGDEKCRRIDDERAAVEAAGGRVVEIAFPSNATWHVESPLFDETERLFADPESYPILVHCFHGRERTVKALAIYDIQFRHMTAQASLAAMPVWGNGHPWPIIAFAFNYETKVREHAVRAACAQPSEVERH